MYEGISLIITIIDITIKTSFLFCTFIFLNTYIIHKIEDKIKNFKKIKKMSKKVLTFNKTYSIIKNVPHK